MPREQDIPACPPKPTPAARTGRSFEIELITPMVGGGAAPGEIDPGFPIRPTAIRGHLRHWWRLIRGYSLGAGMWQREEEIFGSTEFPSPLEVQVAWTKQPELFDPKTLDRFAPEAYEPKKGHCSKDTGILNHAARSL